jgi:predicted RNase H-like HicB family nuclease
MPQYIALIHKDPDSDFGVSFPDLPGCVSAGVDLNEAQAMAAEALALHLEGIAAEGEAPPAPSSLEKIMADPENRDGVAILVSAPPAPVRAVRVNITLPEDVLREIDAYAESKGFTRSGFLANAARKALAS